MRKEGEGVEKPNTITTVSSIPCCMDGLFNRGLPCLHHSFILHGLACWLSFNILRLYLHPIMFPKSFFLFPASVENAVVLVYCTVQTSIMFHPTSPSGGLLGYCVAIRSTPVALVGKASAGSMKWQLPTTLNVYWKNNKGDCHVSKHPRPLVASSSSTFPDVLLSFTAYTRIMRRWSAADKHSHWHQSWFMDRRPTNDDCWSPQWDVTLNWVTRSCFTARRGIE